MEILKQSVQFLKKVGPKMAKRLNRLGIETVEDLIAYYPFRHEDRSKLKMIVQVNDDEETTIMAVVTGHKIIPTRKGNRLLKVVLEDGTGRVEMVCFNQMYLKDTLTRGTQVVVHGRFSRTFNGIEITNFNYEKITAGEDELIHTKRIVPIYSVSKDINLRYIRVLIKRALDQFLKDFKEFLPVDLREEYNLDGFQESIYQIHFPDSQEKLLDAYRRLVFDEFFMLELALALRKRGVYTRKKAQSYQIKKSLLTPFRERLSFQFTQSQRRVINEIFNDMLSPHPMNRLLQGDVGSGKTVVALSSLLLACENGFQGTLMVPTEILAEQHFLNIKKMVDGLDMKIGLVVGRQSSRERKRVLREVEEGKVNLVIGTHALIQEGLKFANLSIAVIDEQHKFGVLERLKLREKGGNLDVLVMTATPIPRTLALTLYGDLDISVIDELPPGRKRIITKRMEEREAYRFLIDEVKNKRQGYVVYPLVNESDKMELKAAVGMAEKLRASVFRNYRVGLIHGQMKKEEKDKTMLAFLDRGFDIIIATTIIEVGIDVPNASVMIIENSDRFGLATLHQLRGRVGRSDYQSYCILLGEPKTEEAKRRLDIMLDTCDGFRIAEEDLHIRGVGEFFGIRQHGMPFFRIGDLIKDHRILHNARKAAFELVNRDPHLMGVKNQGIREKLKKRFGPKIILGEVG